MPAAAEWLGHWAKAANLQPREAVFMQVSRVGKITRERITDRTVSDRIKVRVGAYGRAAGKTKELIEELVRRAGTRCAVVLHDGKREGHPQRISGAGRP
jgi:hypothetical protein